VPSGSLAGEGQRQVVMRDLYKLVRALLECTGVSECNTARVRGCDEWFGVGVMRHDTLAARELIADKQVPVRKW